MSDRVELDLGPVRHWQDGDIHYAENDFIRLAWVVTDDPAKVGTFGWHGPGQIGVEYVDG
jgi:hypothetical protein